MASFLNRRGRSMDTDRGTLMVLKRFLIAALGAFGLGALMTGPVYAQGQIPIPDVLGEPGTACAISNSDVTTTESSTLPASVMALMLGGADGCSDVDDLVSDTYRAAYDDVGTKKRLLRAAKEAVPEGEDATMVQQGAIDFAQLEFDKAEAEKAKYVGDPLADAVYAEQDAIADFTEAHGAVNEPDGGTIAALEAAQMRYDDYSYAYDSNEDGDVDNRDTPVTIDRLTTDLEIQQGIWDANAYDPDGDLKETIPDNALVAADEIAALKSRLSAAERAASSEVSALASAKATGKNAKATLKTAAEAVTQSMKDLVSRVKGAGDTIDTRLANKVTSALKAYENDQEDLMDAEDDLEDEQDELDDFEDDLADAQRDYDAARSDYEDLLDDDGATEDEYQEVEVDLADAAKQLAKAGADVKAAKAKVKGIEEDLDTPKTGLRAVAAASEQALADAQAAQSGTYNFEEGNPVAKLADELLKTPAADGDDKVDQGGALIDALDATWDATQENKTAIDVNSEAIEGLTSDDSAVMGNTAAIAALTAVDDPTTADVDESGAVTSNTAAIAAETTARMEADTALGGRIDTNWDAIAVNQMDIDGLEAEDVRLEGRIDTNWDAIAVNQMGIDGLEAEDVRLEGRIDTNWDAIAVNQMGIAGNTGRIDANEMGIAMNSDAIGANSMNIASNERNISGNTAMIGELSESLEVVRAGVAASMALAGMPAINGRGISIGVGSFDGESAFAVGFQIQNEATSFKIGLTSGGGATGASAGVGFQF